MYSDGRSRKIVFIAHCFFLTRMRFQMGLQYSLRHLGKLWISFLIGIYQSIRCHVRNSHALDWTEGISKGLIIP